MKSNATNATSFAITTSWTYSLP